MEIPDCAYYDSVTVYVYIMKKQINSLTFNQNITIFKFGSIGYHGSCNLWYDKSYSS